MSFKPARQGGSVLMVAMIMLFMLSILGVAAMRGASLEGQLASNSRKLPFRLQNPRPILFFPLQANSSQ